MKTNVLLVRAASCAALIALTVMAAGGRPFAANGSATLNVPRFNHTATDLGNGRVLIVGGENAQGLVAQPELFDASSRTFVVGAALEPRASHSATLLQNGKVLISGGRSLDGTLATSEVFDPATNAMELAAGLTTPRSRHTATLLRDGRVLIAGGDAEQPSAEIIDAEGQVSAPLSEPMQRVRFDHAAVLLQDGRVLIVGGVDASGDPVLSAEIFDPSTLTFEPTGIIKGSLRVRPALHVQSDGKVQVIGGDIEPTVEIYDPRSGIFGGFVRIPAEEPLFSAVLATPMRAALLHELAANVELRRTQHALTEVAHAGAALAAGGRASGQVLDSAVTLETSPASLAADELDYAPRTPVLLTGKGFTPGEIVTIQLHEQPQWHGDRSINVIADENGAFADSSFAPEDHDLDVAFIASARGATSGFVAQTTFTDAATVTTRVTLASVFRIYGQTAPVIRVTFCEPLTDGTGKCTGINDKAIDFTVGGVSEGTVITKTETINGVATPGIATLPYAVVKNAGAYTVTAKFAGDDVYKASSGTASLTVGKVTPAVNPPAPNPLTIVYGTPYSAASWQTPARAVDTTANSAFKDQQVAGSYAYAVLAGSTTKDGASYPSAGQSKSATVTFTPADTANYAGRNAFATVNVSKAPAVLTVSNLSQAEGSVVRPTVSVAPAVDVVTGTPLISTNAAGALVGATITYNGSTTLPTATGVYTVVVKLVNGNYAAPDATGTLVVSGSQTIAFAAPTAPVVAGTPVQLSATASSGLPVTFAVLEGPATIAGNTLTPTGTGTVIVRASQAGTDAIAAAESDIAITVRAAAAVTIEPGSLKQTWDGSAKQVSVTTNPANLPVDVVYTTAGQPVSEAIAPGGYAVVATVTDPAYVADAARAVMVIEPGKTQVKVTGGAVAFDGEAHAAATQVSAVPGAENLGAASYVTYLRQTADGDKPLSGREQNLAAFGEFNASNGFPEWYEDRNGLRLGLCLDSATLCLSTLPTADLTNPNTGSVGDTAATSNFPDEAFFWAAEASVDLPAGGSADLVMATEAAFAQELPAKGDQLVFGRIRIRVDDLVQGASYRVTHPYGSDEFDNVASGPRGINMTEDIGIDALGSGALFSRIGPEYLTWDSYGTSLDAPPAGYIGDPSIPHKVKGGTNGVNYFRVERIDPVTRLPLETIAETDLFSVSGRVYSGDVAAHVDAGAAAEITTGKYLKAIGGFDAAVGFPKWYQDSRGVRLELCLESATLCLTTAPDTTKAPGVTSTAAASNFPDEAFYWSGESTIDLPSGGKALLVLAAEAAFAAEVPRTGDQVVFGRVRIRIDAPRAGSYRITHPYGVDVFDNVAVGTRTINATQDVGVDRFPGGILTSRIGPFLTWDTFGQPEAAGGPPVGYVGDPQVEHKVIGSPLFDQTGRAQNYFRIEWKNPATGAWELVAENDLFAVSGKLAGTLDPPVQPGTYEALGTFLGNATYGPSAGSAQIVIEQPVPTITVSVPENLTAGTVLTPALLGATATFAGVAVPGTFAFEPVVVPEGTATFELVVTFEPTDAARFGQATLAVTATAGPTDQTIAIEPVTETLVAGSTVELTAAASSGLPVTFEVVSGPATVAGSALTLTGGGTVVVQAIQAGDEAFAPAQSLITLTVERSEQTVTMTPVAGPVKIGQVVPLAASASSGLPVTFEVVSGTGTIAGNVLVATADAPIVIRALQAGNEVYAPAQAEITVTVAVRVTVTIDKASLSQVWNGQPRAVTVTTAPAQVPVTIAYATAGQPVAAPTAPGAYTVLATVSDPAYDAAPARGMLIITPAPTSVSVADVAALFDGASHAVNTSVTSGAVDLGDASYVTYIPRTADGDMPQPDRTPVLKQLGQINPANGFPEWYEDTNNLRLGLCLDSATLCLSTLPVPNADGSNGPGVVGGTPAESNFPDEAFYWAAEASVPVGTGSADIVMATEAAFANELPASGDQMVFARIRIRVDNLEAGASYLVTHPYGTDRFDNVEGGPRGINMTEDIGIESFPMGALAGRIGPYLTWDTFGKTPDAGGPPAGYIGDPQVEHAVTGSPNGTNFFRVQKIEADGTLTEIAYTDTFTVAGRLYTGTATEPYQAGAPQAPLTSGKYLKKVGGFDAKTGFPKWYEDARGVRLAMCLDSDTLCLSTLPKPGPASIEASAAASNFPDEAFYWSGEASIDLAGGGRALLVLAAEAAFSRELPIAGDQLVFGRVRIRIDAPKPGTYRVTHPYGVDLFENVDAGTRTINATQDVGVDQFATGILKSRIGPFLTWDTFGKPIDAGGPPSGYVGDPQVEHAVVGSPLFDETGRAQNYFRIEWKNPETGAWEIIDETDQFTVSGKLAGSLSAPSAPGTYDAVATFLGRDGYGPSAGYGAVVIDAVVPTITWEPASLSAGSTLGAAQLNATASEPGTFVYDPPAGTALAAGAHTLRVMFTPDAPVGHATATATVTITVANAAPVASDDAFATNEDTALSGNVLANDSDADGNPLTAALETNAQHGVVTIAASGSFEYRPNADFVGTDGFTYSVADGQGGNARATVTVVVSGVNDGPHAANDVAVTAEDMAIDIDVLTNDGDIDGDTLTIASFSQGALGVVTTTGGRLRYAPNPNVSGLDAFSYTVADATGATATATVAVTVQAVNDAPVGAADKLLTFKGETLTLAGPGVLANDTDIDDGELRAVLVTAPAHGSLTLHADGSLVYVPGANADGTAYIGTDSFQYAATDSAAAAAVVDVTITVATAAVETTAPAAETVSTDPGTGATADAPVQAAVTTPTGGSIAIVATETTATGQAEFVYYAPQVEITAPPASAEQPMVMTFRLDASVLDQGQNENTVEIFRDGVAIAACTTPGPEALPDPCVASRQLVDNDIVITVRTTHASTWNFGRKKANVLPEAGNDAYATEQGKTLAVAAPGVLGNDRDADKNTLTVKMQTPPQHGSVTMSPDGGFSYTPAAGYSGSDSFTYAVNDGAVESSYGTVTLTVTATAVETRTSAITSSASSTTYGQNVTLSATVSSAAGVPTGSVEYFDNGASLGSAPVGAGGVAALVTGRIAVGQRSITAAFRPTGNFLASAPAAAVTQVVNKASTTSAFTLNTASRQYSDRVQMDATITPATTGGDAPAQSVSFKMGTQVLATIPFVQVNGAWKASGSVPLLEDAATNTQVKPGLRYVTAVFNGVSANYTVANPTMKSMSVTAEDARVAWPSTSLATDCATCNTVTLRALVKDISATADAGTDVDGGDIRKATVTFINRATGATIGTATLSLPTPGETRVAEATYKMPVTLPSSGSQTFNIGVVVNGYYVRNNAADNVTVTVKKGS